MAEYTQDQIDTMIADSKKGLFTEAELTSRVTAEVDRRVDTGIKKGVETQKAKWEQELADKANLSADALAQKKIDGIMGDLEAKEKTISKRANTLDAKDLLSEAKIPKAHYDKFIGVLVTNDAETTTTNVNNFIELFNATKTEIETEVKSALSNIKKPDTGDKDTVITKEKFTKMGYAKQVAFKQSNPSLYSEYIK